MLKCRVAKSIKKKYIHYLNYKNYSQSVLSKLISGSFALVSLRMVRFFKPTRERVY